MEIETVSDLAEKLADMLGVYGACKHVPGESSIYDSAKPVTCPYEVNTCCRVKFVGLMETRIREAVANEKLLSHEIQFKDETIDTVGNCANCGVEYHIHKNSAGY